MRYHLTRNYGYYKKGKDKRQWGYREKGTLFMVGGVYIGKQYGGSAKEKEKKRERERELPYVLAILLLGIHPRKQKH